MFQGGFLEDLGAASDPAFDMWLAKERLRLRGLARIAGEAFLRERHVDTETIAAARALLRIDRAHDGAWRALIQAHLEGNDRAAARFACEQWRDAMGLARDQTPPADMAAFLARIRGGPEDRSPPFSISYQDKYAWAPARRRNRGGASRSRGNRAYGLAFARCRSSGRMSIRRCPPVSPRSWTTALSRFRWISCVSGSSLGAISGEAGDANVRWSDIGLDLDFWIGTIQRGGDRLRITVRLLDLRAGGSLIWANRFEHAAGTR